MPTDFPMTYDELMNNYEYKVAKKLLLREYPWIKDVYAKEDEVNNYNIIFLELIIDPYELARKMGWTVVRWVTSYLKQGENYWSPYLSSFFDGNEMYEKTIPLNDEINNALRNLHSSPALPKDLRLPDTRKFQTGSYIATPAVATPEDTDK